jgi:hypothetical protein
MTEPVLKMVGLANDDKPNAVADIFADEMMDRVAGNVQAAKDVISNSMFDQELEIEMPDELEEPVDVEVEEEGDVDEQETFESDQEILAEPDDQDEESEESED